MIPAALRGPVFGRLGFRLMAAVAIAMTPLALLSYNQAEKFESAAQARWKTALFGETLLAATPQIDRISHARGLAAATANAILPLAGDTEACTAVMRRLAGSDPDVTFAGFIPPDGRMACASTGRPYSFAGTPSLLAAVAMPVPAMTVNARGPITGESVLIFTHPVTDAAGHLLGFVSLSVPHRALDRRSPVLLDAGNTSNEPLALVTFDGEGTKLTSAGGLSTADGKLPADRPLAEFVGKPPATFVGRSRDGAMRTFAVLEIVPGALYVLGSWPASAASVSPLDGYLPLWALPLLMWMASLLAAWIAAEHQVLRPVRSLRHSIIAFAGGSRTIEQPNVLAAPNELRDVGDAFERMMSAVIQDEAELENTIRQKEILLREVHHRVKNNLQLIASIMNLQMRRSVAPEAATVLKGLHDRVMSLATVHRELYQTSGLAEVRADELLQKIAGQVMRFGASAERQVETVTDFDPISLTPDQAVPLSLILSEALTNVLKHSGGTDDGRPRLSVSLKSAAPGRAELRIGNSLAPAGPGRAASDPGGAGLGNQLLSAFATQLSGDLTFGEDDGRYVVRLVFPVSDTRVGDSHGDAGQEYPARS
ncbi:MAG: sensor histidine kinase [Paracoccaceae bacterium]